MTDSCATCRAYLARQDDSNYTGICRLSPPVYTRGAAVNWRPVNATDWCLGFREGSTGESLEIPTSSVTQTVVGSNLVITTANTDGTLTTTVVPLPVTTPARQPVSISGFSVDNAGYGAVVVCNDGTMWVNVFAGTWSGWDELSGVTQP